MQIEIRADNTAHISGYVNAVQRESRAVITPHGKVNEEIEPGVFADAINRAESVPMCFPSTSALCTAKGQLPFLTEAEYVFGRDIIVLILHTKATVQPTREP